MLTIQDNRLYYTYDKTSSSISSLEYKGLPKDTKPEIFIGFDDVEKVDEGVSCSILPKIRGLRRKVGILDEGFLENKNGLDGDKL